MAPRPYSIALLCSFLLFHCAQRASAGPLFYGQVRARIEQQLGPEVPREGFLCRGEPICGVQLIPSYYQKRDYQPIWIDHLGLRPSAQTLAGVIETAAHREGLRAADYHIAAIRNIIHQLDDAPFPPDTDSAAIWADLDLLLTDAFLSMAAHLSGGRVNPETLHPDWILSERSIDLLTYLEDASGGARVAEVMDQLQPKHSGYVGLRDSLATLREVDASGGWPTVEGKMTLRPLDTNEQVINLRRRLMASGDYRECPPPADPGIYDQGLEVAVKLFQKRHGLKPDGAVGSMTRAALNTSIKARLRQVELNLERWRWLPRDLGERYIAVNTADFNLRVVEKDKTIFRMPVVVGRPARQTPVFSAKMSYLVLNPYWNVPYTIAVKDILPKLIDGEDYLSHMGIRVFSDWSKDAVEIDPDQVVWSNYGRSNFPFRLRQDPGERNALGRIKFIFPNKFAVYLHDTPQRSHFKRIQRDFSSGCIRVENAPLLAAYLLSEDHSWSPETLSAALASGARRVVRIPLPIRVHLLYMTAWMDDQGKLQFREDIYDRDGALDEALQQRNPYLPPGLNEGAAVVTAPKA
jgi:murein L,D-transpeptidase YcbB/YkuD